jgi:hypothetical protein
MLIKFCQDDGGTELYSQESNDVAGIIAAATGEKVIFHDDFYKYDNHILNHYVDGNGKWNQEVIIYLKDYNS